MHEVLYIKVCMNFAFSDIDPLDPVEEIFKAEVHETSSRWSTKSLISLLYSSGNREILADP